ncbi:hypothetical protein LEMLEM_LOCUS5219 [Lemmus lemmus]
MTWGIPRESGIQKAHTRSPAQYSQTRLRRRRQGAVIVGRHRACPGRGRGGLPGAAALGAGEQQPLRRRLAQPPGSRAPLRVGGAPRRCAHLTGGPPRRRPPRLGCRPRAACELVLLGSARAPLGLGCGVSGSCRLGSRGLPTCPGCRAGLHASPAAPPPAAADAIARARTKPRSGVARVHTLPPSPLPRALPPASRAARRLRSLRVLPRAHTLPTHTRPGAHSRSHTCAGGGEGDPGLDLGGGGTPGG